MEASGGAESLRPVSRSTPNDPVGVRESATPETRRLGAFRASAVAGLVLAAVNCAAIALQVPTGAGGLKLRALHYWVDTAQHLVFALAIGAVIGAYQHTIAPYLLRGWPTSTRRGARMLLGVLAAGVGILALFSFTLPQDFDEVARRAGARDLPAYFGLGMVSACAAGLALVLVSLHHGSRPVLSAVAVLVAAGLFAINHVVLPDDYPGVHLAIASTGIFLMIAGLTRRTVFECWTRPSRVAVSGVLALCLPALVIPPTRTLLAEQLRSDGSGVAIWLARTKESLRQRGETDIAFRAKQRGWFLARRAEETPPSLIPLLPDDPIIILITLDALRADLVVQPKHLRQLPTLRRLREQSVYFSEARAPSCQTVTTLSSMFSGLYSSQQHWSRDPESSVSFPGDDKTLRFPQLFQHAGVRTVVAPATYFLVNEYGVVRGFDEQALPRTSSLDRTGFTDGAHLSERAINVLEEHQGGPLFLYVHYLDARYPYSAGGPRKPGLERYLGAVSYIDRQVGRVLQAARRLGLWDRAVVVLASDYGDALGEHDSTHDTETLYEEQLHVPLMIRVPGVRSREVNQMVSLMDVGPTLLDMMGLDTPAHFMGQSLAPYLRGRGARLTRPIVAEVRLTKALYFGDGYKLIVDDGQHTEELYHLKADPEERVNVVDRPSAKGKQRLAQLRQFFSTHGRARSRHEAP